MKIASLFALSLLLASGCTPGGNGDKEREEKTKPTFLFWCFRQEIVESGYHIPDMATPAAAAYLQDRLKAVPGYEGSSYDLASRTMTVKYQGSTVRKMNFEEAIAQSGFAVNQRPANPNAKLPEGIR